MSSVGHEVIAAVASVIVLVVTRLIERYWDKPKDDDDRPAAPSRSGGEDR